MSEKLKYKLPNLIKLDKKFDIDRLLAELSKIQNGFIPVLQANGQLCANNHRLVKNVYDHFEQINLTKYKDQKEVTLELCEETYNTNSAKARIRRENIDPSLDERNYNYPTDGYVGSYFEEIANSFICKPIRVRLTKLNAGKELDPHIDYDPSYAVRIIIPLVTHPEVLNQFWRKEEYSEVHMPADGSAYFINTGVKHSVVNRSPIDRIALMFSLDGTADIEQYVK